MKISSLKNSIINLLFPPKCIVCGEMIDALKDIKAINCICPKCRVSYESMFFSVCSECNKSVARCTCGVKRRTTEIAPLAKCFYYKPDRETYIGNRIIFQLKRMDDKRIAQLLANELAEIVLCMLKSEGMSPEDCMFTFVPRRRGAIHKYGFDQGRRLAYYTAKALSCKENFKSLLLRRGSREQKKLDANARDKNLAKALSIRPRYAKYVKDKIICVIDDVVTSGATMRAAEKTLVSYGAKRVVFACVAKTKSDK